MRTHNEQPETILENDPRWLSTDFIRVRCLNDHRFAYERGTLNPSPPCPICGAPIA